MVTVITVLLEGVLLFLEPYAISLVYLWFVFPETHFALSYWAFFGLNFIMAMFSNYVSASDYIAVVDRFKGIPKAGLDKMILQLIVFLGSWAVVFIVHVIVH